MPFSFADVEPAREIDAEEFGRGVAEAVRGYVDRTVNARCAALDAKIAMLEAQIEAKTMTYMGVWKDGRIYSRGNVVTYDGSSWHSNDFHNKGRPGNGSSGWSLMVKHGERGRDAKGAA
jgi:hypothetical protein